MEMTILRSGGLTTVQDLGRPGHRAAGVPAGRIVLRNILRIIDLALVLPIFFVFISPASQRIGDLAARTLVVKDDSLEAQPKDVEEPPQDIEPPAPA